MKFHTTKTNYFEMFVRKLTRIIKQNTNCTDETIVIKVNQIVNMLFVIDDHVNAKILDALLYKYTICELEKMEATRCFSKKIFIIL